MPDPTFIGSESGQNGTGGSPVQIDVPAGTQDGDTMFAFIFSHGGTATTSGASGWTVEHELEHSDGGFDYLTVLKKVASSEPASYSFSDGVDNRTAGVIHTWRDVDSTTPIEVEASQSNTNSSTVTAPSVTPLTAGAGIIWFGGLGGASTTGAVPTGYTAAGSAASSGGGPGSVKVTVAAGYKESQPASATGAQSATFGASGDSIGIQIVLKPTAGGGATFTQEVGGSISFTGGLSKRAAKNLSGAVSPAGTVVKMGTKLLSGSVGFSGGLVKTATKVLSGAVSPAGALVTAKSTLKLLDGVVSFSGNLVKTTTRILVGAVTPTGALSKTSSKVLSGAVGFSGGLVRTATKILTGEVSFSGAVETAKLTLQLLTGSISPSGTVVKTTNKVLAGVIGPSGALVKVSTKVLNGVITPTGQLVKSTFKVLAGTISPSGALTALRTVIKAVSGVVSFSGDSEETFIPGGEPPPPTLFDRLRRPFRRKGRI